MTLEHTRVMPVRALVFKLGQIWQCWFRVWPCPFSMSPNYCLYLASRFVVISTQRQQCIHCYCMCSGLWPPPNRRDTGHSVVMASVKYVSLVFKTPLAAASTGSSMLTASVRVPPGRGATAVTAPMPPPLHPNISKVHQANSLIFTYVVIGHRAYWLTP